MPDAQPLQQAPGHQQHRARRGQHGSDAVGDGRPGPQAVIGVPLLFGLAHRPGYRMIKEGGGRAP